MTAPALILIPALNEEQSLPAVLEALRRDVPECDVLVIDDGSSDGTADVARRAGVLLARLPYNLGVGGAMRTGFRFAADAGYLRAVQFDADGQHDVAAIPRLLAALDGGNDLVIGSRFADATTTYKPGRVRGGAMGMLRRLVSLLAGQRFTDTSSGFRAYSRTAIEYFARAFPLEYLSDTVESLLLAVYAGMRVSEVPVTMQKRAAGLASTRNLRLAYHYVRMLAVLATMASRRHRQAGSARA
jgi:glycosyltransferase involved in cell wall biosynthesis